MSNFYQWGPLGWYYAGHKYSNYSPSDNATLRIFCPKYFWTLLLLNSRHESKLESSNLKVNVVLQLQNLSHSFQSKHTSIYLYTSLSLFLHQNERNGTYEKDVYVTLDDDSETSRQFLLPWRNYAWGSKLGDQKQYLKHSCTHILCAAALPFEFNQLHFAKNCSGDGCPIFFSDENKNSINGTVQVLD